MSRLKFLFFILVLFFLSGCYESEIIIELNPDGSGVMSSILNFDKATQEQRQQVKQLFNRDSQSNFSPEKIKENFPPSRFEIIEVQEDNEALSFKSVVKFKDINHLLAVGAEHTKLKGVDFKVEGDELIFTITRSSQESGFGKNIQFKSGASEFKDSIQPKETVRIIDDQMGREIVFEHEYGGDEVDKEIKWEGRLRISNHTIKRNKIKYNFADHPVIFSPQANVMEAKWVREKKYNSRMSQSRLDLELSVQLPLDEGINYLGYDQKYLLSGKFSDGSEAKLDKSWGEQFKRFNDTNNMIGSNKFKLSVDLSFPKSPADGLDPLKLRVRLLSGKDLKRVDLGLLESNQTYEAEPFTFTTKDLSNNKLALEIKGPMGQLQNYFIKTQRGNIFPIKSSNSSGFDDHGNVGFWETYPLQGAGLLVEFYESSEHVWLDMQTEKLNLTRNKLEGKEGEVGGDLFRQIFPEYQTTIVPEDIYESKEAFEQYWDDLEDIQLIPAVLKVSYDTKRLRGECNNPIYSWYQTDLGRKLKERNIDRKELADKIFQLFLEMPDQNSNTSMLFFLTNAEADFLKSIRGKALQTVKDKKLRNGISSIFKGDLSEEERKVFHEVFEQSDYWVEKVDILKLLTKGEQGDLDFAEKVLKEESWNHRFVRQHAFEALLDGKSDMDTEFIKVYVLDPSFDWMDLQKISQRLGSSRMQGQISEEKLIQLLIPLRSIFEDFSENKSNGGLMVKEAKKILEAIDQ